MVRLPRLIKTQLLFDQVKLTDTSMLLVVLVAS